MRTLCAFSGGLKDGRGYGMDGKLANKKAQGFEMPIVVLIVVLATILVLAPFTLKIINAVVTPLGTNLQDISPLAASSAATVVTQTNNFWDLAVVIAFLVITIVMFISAYMVDMNPIFAVVYAILAFFLFMITPLLQDLFTGIYTNDALTNQTQALPMTNFIQGHFIIITFALFIISGIIMYAKLRGRGQSYG